MSPRRSSSYPRVSCLKIIRSPAIEFKGKETYVVVVLGCHRSRAVRSGLRRCMHPFLLLNFSEKLITWHFRSSTSCPSSCLRNLSCSDSCWQMINCTTCTSRAGSARIFFSFFKRDVGESTQLDSNRLLYVQYSFLRLASSALFFFFPTSADSTKIDLLSHPAQVRRYYGNCCQI
jgi:hypothetical protein